MNYQPMGLELQLFEMTKPKLYIKPLNKVRNLNFV